MRLGHFDDNLENENIEETERNNDLDNNEKNDYKDNGKLRENDNFSKDIDNNNKDKLENSDNQDLEDNERYNPDKKLEKDTNDYFNDLKNRSEYPETISDRPFELNDLKRITPEENVLKREEFDDNKKGLKKDWEDRNGMDWPKYKEDVYSESGKPIRKIGDDYDAHHIQPLCLGGENTAENVTPMHASEHYDHKGVHSKESPYSQIIKDLGE